jgi:hypothetical protein
MIRGKRAPGAALPIVVVALVLSSCGGDGESDGTATTAAPAQNLTAGLSGQEREAAATIEAYLAAFDSGDPERICPLTSLTEAALERCEETLPEFDPPRDQPPFELRKIEINGGRADATIVRKRGTDEPIFFQLQRADGEWKVVVATLQG